MSVQVLIQGRKGDVPGHADRPKLVMHHPPTHVVLMVMPCVEPQTLKVRVHGVDISCCTSFPVPDVRTRPRITRIVQSRSTCGIIAGHRMLRDKTEEHLMT